MAIATRHRFNRILLASIAMLSATSRGHAAEIPGSAPLIVHMSSLAYEPKTIEIQPGQGIEWVNGALTGHSAISNDGGKTFDTGIIPPGGHSRQVVFNGIGTFPYHCKMHGKTMSGVVIVKGRP